jgi:negative regulator of sigma E activity
MTVTRETLMAFVDGELAPDEERRVAAEVAKDPALNAYVEQQKKLAGTLKSAFASVLDAPIPERIERAVRETPVPSASLLARLQRFWHERKTRTSQTWIPAAALAAGIALGILLDGSFGSGTDIRTKDGALIAQGALAQALTLELASEQTPDTRSAARIGVSFRSADGLFCRSFETQTGARGTIAGIACLKDGGWQIAALAGAAPRAEGEFTTAGGDMPPVIRSALGAMIAGDPLDAAQERAARDQGWQPR